MPNDVMWMDMDRGGMGWANLYDEVTIDRTMTWIKHANSDGVEHRIASAAVFWSEGLTKSNRPILEGEPVRPWDGTMMGRIMEWMSSDIGKYFQIEGNTHNEYKELDVAIADHLTSTKKQKATYGGENHSRRMQEVCNTLVIANDDRRWKHVGSRTSKQRRIQQRRHILVGLQITHCQRILWTHSRGSTNHTLPMDV
jgi:hypothetical protein